MDTEEIIRARHGLGRADGRLLQTVPAQLMGRGHALQSCDPSIGGPHMTYATTSTTAWEPVTAAVILAQYPAPRSSIVQASTTVECRLCHHGWSPGPSMCHEPPPCASISESLA